jgi:short-subunit dehydrogenase
MSVARPLALITGASSGIGEALVHCFAGAGHDVALVARSAGKLRELAALVKEKYCVQAMVMAADLAEPGAAGLLAATLTGRNRIPDVLVNCAGVLEQQAFADTPPDKHQAIIDLNISALTAMLANFLPPMVARGSGRVLNVASVAAFQPIPLLATYAASKAYVLSLSESLSEELKPSGVTVTALCPGITATHMLTAAAQANQQLRKLPGFLVGAVEEVARQGYEACMKGDAICVPGAVNQAAMLASRGAPKWLVRRIGGLIARKTQ